MCAGLRFNIPSYLFMRMLTDFWIADQNTRILTRWQLIMKKIHYNILTYVVRTIGIMNLCIFSKTGFFYFLVTVPHHEQTGRF